MQETESMSGGDPSKMGDTRGDENFSCLNMNWQALEWAGYSGSRYDIRTDPQARSNASILSTVRYHYLKTYLHLAIIFQDWHQHRPQGHRHIHGYT